MAMESKDQELIPDIATDAVLVKSEEMPKDAKICEGKLYLLRSYPILTMQEGELSTHLFCF